ncbi:MAG: hypothetical protein H6Q40_94 [Deltaproteobacteria bacterium]|nr:hypothetical protein [Deltaproteobacteria bacterium]
MSFAKSRSAGAPEVPRNESYYKYVAMTRNEGNAADGHFSAAREEQADDFHMIGLREEIDEGEPLKGIPALSEETEVP